MRALSGEIGIAEASLPFLRSRLREKSVVCETRAVENEFRGELDSCTALTCKH